MADNPAMDTLSPRAMPRQRRAIERRRAILDAAFALLGDHGVEGITTSLIAARAGVPVASVYGYFPNKMAVIAELMREATADVDSQLETLMPAAADHESRARAIDSAIDTIVAGYRALPARQRLFSAVRGNEVLEPIARASDARMTAALAAALMRSDPDMPPLRAQAVAMTVVQTFTALQEGVVTCADPALFTALVEEWRILIKAYLLPRSAGQAD